MVDVSLYNVGRITFPTNIRAALPVYCVIQDRRRDETALAAFSRQLPLFPALSWRGQGGHFVKDREGLCFHFLIHPVQAPERIARLTGCLYCLSRTARSWTWNKTMLTCLPSLLSFFLWPVVLWKGAATTLVDGQSGDGRQREDELPARSWPSRRGAPELRVRTEVIITVVCGSFHFWEGSG